MTRIKYPAGPVTPHGRYHIRKGELPEVSLISPNDQIVVWLMGGHAIADPYDRPESVQVRDIRGLIAPWETIDQQGATEDGVTFVDALYGPTEIDVDVTLFARDAKHLRRMRRHLFEALDVKDQSELGWMTHELGYWWAPIRWWKKPDNPEGPPQQARQDLTLRLRGDSGFWQSYPDLASFGFVYDAITDTFNAADYTSVRNLGPNWPIRYNGDGGGYLYSNGRHALWLDDPDDLFTTRTREAVAGPYKDFHSVTDNQVVHDVLGSFPEWSLSETGANDLWARMNRNPDGTWAGDGIRLRRTTGRIYLSAFVNFVEVWTRSARNWLIPYPGDKWSLAAGYEDDPRLFKVFRNDGEVLKFKEPEPVSMLGSSHRGVGFGVRAAGALITQASPAIVRKVAAGDNAAVSQTGFLERNNAGDQDAYDEYTLYGPATKFEIANGPGSTDMIEFGPMAAGEVVHIRTDPRRKGVFDLTERVGEEVSPALFGASPTDTMYRRMKGRFTSECAIPKKQPGMRVQTHLVKCAITGGNADSKIEAALVPLRRYPQ